MAKVVYTGAGAAAAFAIFIAFAQTHVVAVPYLTPPLIEIQGLQEIYSINGSANFTISVRGYGSNCHMLKVEALYLGGDLQNERVSFYKKADDCRFMTITHGPYNLTRSFDYGGKNVFGVQGPYKLDVEFEDLVDGTKVSATRNLEVR